MANQRDELELEKLQAEVHKFVAEARKMIAETHKLKRETSFYPFVAAGGLITVIVTAAAFIHKLPASQYSVADIDLQRLRFRLDQAQMCT
ncbi:hypothetical protein [Pseudomonas syringae]|uniref:hypothetical protein n=1 Tax=Pseudomonas syringae TaxID=317 RepID=UPI00315A8FC1